MHEVDDSPDRSDSLQQRFQVVADSGTLAIWEADLRTGEIVWSTQGHPLLVVAPENGAKTVDELLAHVHPEDRPRAVAALKEAIASGVAHWRERLRLLLPDGKIRHISVQANFVPGENGQAERMIALVVDVSDLAEKEQRLRETEERLRTAYAAAKVWTCRLDLENWTISRPSQADDAGTPQFGPEQSFQEWLERVHPEDRARVESGMKRAIETGDLWEDEFRLLWPDGRYHWIYDRGRTLAGSGQSRIFAGAAMDIDERKHVEQQLIENEERLRSAYMAGKMWPWEIEITSGEIRRSGDLGVYRGPGHFASISASEWLEYVHPEDRQRVRFALERAIRGDGLYNCDYRLRWKDEEYRWVSSRGGLIQDTRGSWKLMGIGRDCTEEKETANALEESERIRLLAIEGAQMGVFVQDISSGRIQWSNRQFEIFGISPEEFGGHRDDFRKLVLPEDLAAITQEHDRLIAGRGKRFRFEFRIKRPNDGEIRWITSIGEVKYDDSGDALSMVGVNYDITARKHQEEALRESERLRRLSLRAAGMGAFEWNFVSGEIGWSPEQYQLLKFDPATTVPTLDMFEDRVHPEDLPRIRQLMRMLVQQQEKRYGSEFRIVWPDGTVRWLRTLGEFVYDVNGRVIRMFGVNWDVTEQKEAEEKIVQLNRELQRKVADFEALMHAMPVAVAVGLDPESRDIRVNPTFAQMLGINDPDGGQSMSSGTVLPFRVTRDGRDVRPEELPQRKAARLGQEVRNEEFELITSDNRKIDMFGHAVPILDENGAVQGTLAAYMDITERKRAEKALRTSEKLATAGKMAASLAHEINNPLAAVTNLLYLVAQDASLGEHSQKFITMATGELARVSQITRNILAFYRESHSPLNTDLADLMASVLELYTPKIRQSNVEVNFQRDGVCNVLAFPGELRQVFSNLIVNAVDAMPNGGRLQIRVRPSRGRSQDRGVRLLVADTGTGIPRQQLTHVFEPFFTTKGEKGTGLGLWVSRDIIAKHDGTIHIRTSSVAPKSGTCFSIFFPSESTSVRKRATQKANSVSSNA